MLLLMTLSIAWRRELFARDDALCFFVSDPTGNTVKALGRSVLSQFEGLAFEAVVLPDLNAPETIRGRSNRSMKFKRRRGSLYASLKQCRRDVRAAEELYLGAAVPFLNTGVRSIEEIASRIVEDKSMKRADCLLCQEHC